MTNQQKLYEPARTVVLEWIKWSKDGSRARQYALWTSGEIITRIAHGERRVGLWEERTWMRFTKENIKSLNKLLIQHGYQRSFTAPSDNFIVSRRVSRIG